MGKKDNLNKAMFDMFGLGKEDAAAEESAAERETAKGKAVLKAGSASAPKKIIVDEMPSPSTYIAPSVEIVGCIKAKGDVDIAGILKGDVSSESAVTVRSSVDGNISAKHLNLIDCVVNGDITASESVVITEKSTVNGNITAGSVNCSGKVNGDIVATESLSMDAMSYVVGNITAAAVSVARGAVIKGKLSM